jgi:hypothetical protein
MDTHWRESFRSLRRPLECPDSSGSQDGFAVMNLTPLSFLRTNAGTPDERRLASEMPRVPRRRSVRNHE